MTTAEQTAAEAEAAAAAALTEEVVAEEAEHAEGSDLEARARRFGWKDKSEFGAGRLPERWVDAETFLQRQETNLPVLKENLHRLEGRYEQSQAQIARLEAEGTARDAALTQLRDLTQTAELRAFERAKAELQGRIGEAAKVADVAAVNAAASELAALKQPAVLPQVARPAVATTPIVDQEELAAVQDFRRLEGWFTSDTAAQALAVAEYDRQLRQPGSPKERLARVREAVAKRFPEHFPENPAAMRAAAVATPSGGGARPAGKLAGWNSLPADVRAVAGKMISDVNKGRKDGKTFTKEDYAATYLKANGAN